MRRFVLLEVGNASVKKLSRHAPLNFLSSAFSRNAIDQNQRRSYWQATNPQAGRRVDSHQCIDRRSYEMLTLYFND
jgi:hypothetical protein